MSLSPKITVYPGTERQQNVGIMGRATLEIVAGNVTVAKFNQIEVRKSKQGKWWVKYPSEDDRTGKQDENGYPVSYPYFVLFPGPDGKNNRDAIHDKIISECQNSSQSSGMTTAAPQRQNTQPTIQTAPPVVNTQPQASDDGLQWDLD